MHFENYYYACIDILQFPIIILIKLKHAKKINVKI